MTPEPTQNGTQCSRSGLCVRRVCTPGLCKVTPWALTRARRALGTGVALVVVRDLDGDVHIPCRDPYTPVLWGTYPIQRQTHPGAQRPRAHHHLTEPPETASGGFVVSGGAEEIEALRVARTVVVLRDRSAFSTLRSRLCVLAPSVTPRGGYTGSGPRCSQRRKAAAPANTKKVVGSLRSWLRRAAARSYTSSGRRCSQRRKGRSARKHLENNEISALLAPSRRCAELHELRPALLAEAQGAQRPQTPRKQ